MALNVEAWIEKLLSSTAIIKTPVPFYEPSPPGFMRIDRISSTTCQTWNGKTKEEILKNIDTCLRTYWDPAWSDLFAKK